jgi:hypothetical protein
VALVTVPKGELPRITYKHKIDQVRLARQAVTIQVEVEREIQRKENA